MKKFCRTISYVTAAAIMTMAFFAFLFVPNIAKAAEAGKGGIGATIQNFVGSITGIFITGMAVDAITKVIFILGLIINFLISVAILVVGWVLGFVMFISGNIVNSPIVEAGFPVSLSLANLGFVLGIIVIAVATMLRSQTYGMKQLLVNFIVMAVLVNFGLVIAGSIINFVDELTLYFIRSISPVGSSASVGEGLASFSNFVVQITGAFQPQKLNEYPDISKLSAENLAKLSAAFAEESSIHVVQNLAGLLIGTFVMLSIVIVLVILVIMLIYRYVSLAFLLVLLPLAWLSWVFPAMKENSKKWWDKFLHQAFFAPIITFFLFLTIETSKALNNVEDPLGKAFDSYNNQGDGSFKALLSLVTEVFRATIENSLRGVVLVSILMGGLIAANKFGIELAGAAQKGIGGMKGWATGKLATAGLKGGRAAYQKVNLQALGAKMAASGFRPASAMGRMMMTLPAIGGKDLVSQAKEFAAMENDQIISSLNGSMPAEKQFAAIAEMAKRKKLGKIETVNGMSLVNFRDTREQLFKDYGQGKLIDEIDKQNAGNKKMRDAAKAKDQVSLDRETDEWRDKMSQEEGREINLEAILNRDERIGLDNDTMSRLEEALVRSFVKGGGRLIPGVLYKIKSSSALEQYAKLHSEAIEKERKRIKALPDGPEKNRANQQITRAEKVYDSAIANHAFSFVPPIATEQPGTQAPQQPSQPPPPTGAPTT